MKKLMIIAAMMVVSVCANAQMFVKPMVGGTLSTITGDNTDNYKFKVGLVAGGEFGYFITDKFAATAGLLYTMEGTKIKHADHNTNLEYLNIPVLANYYIIPGLAVKAGIQPGFLTKAKHGDTDIKEDCKTRRTASSCSPWATRFRSKSRNIVDGINQRPIKRSKKS